MAVKPTLTPQLQISKRIVCFSRERRAIQHSFTPLERDTTRVIYHKKKMHSLLSSHITQLIKQITPFTLIDNIEIQTFKEINNSFINACASATQKEKIIY